MRLSIRNKLFLTLLVATTCVVAVMYGFMHLSFQHGFVSLLEHRQQERVDRLVDVLTSTYESEGGWQGLSQDRGRWRLLQEGMGHGPFMGMGPGHGGPGPNARPFGPGLTLLDADKHWVVGRPVAPGDLVLTPIKVEDRIVGFVGYLPGSGVEDLVDRRFAETQRRAFVWIALLVGVVSAALAWPLASTLVRPLARVTAAARALAAGHFQTRVSVTSGDELGDLARDFNDMAQTLEKTESARRQWMADISHELRTPLALMRAELEAVQDGVRPLDGAYVAALQSDVDRLSRLVEDLYQLSMTDLGAMSYRKRPVDPVALLEDDVDAVSGEFERQGLDVVLRNETTQLVTMQADPDRLSQLFRNLMQNSLRYTDAPGRLEIVVKVVDGRLHMDFSDTPPGVPVDALPHLFDRFFRVEASRSRAHGGAGLGLAICRNVVEAHDGRIEARPSKLGGLTLHIELPVTP